MGKEKEEKKKNSKKWGKGTWLFPLPQKKRQSYSGKVTKSD
jgi:hypothetical protein